MTHDEALALYNAGANVVAKILCDLSKTIESQQEQIKALELKIAKLSKNSSNSSKPPSSDDITKPKPKKEKKKGKRKIGGQPGHKRHERPLFSEEVIDKFHSYILTACPD
jgi:transposase